MLRCVFSCGLDPAITIQVSEMPQSGSKKGQESVEVGRLTTTVREAENSEMVTEKYTKEGHKRRQSERQTDTVEVAWDCLQVLQSFKKNTP